MVWREQGALYGLTGRLEKNSMQGNMIVDESFEDQYPVDVGSGALKDRMNPREERERNKERLEAFYARLKDNREKRYRGASA